MVWLPPAGLSPLSEDYDNAAARAPAPRNWLADKINPTTGELLSIAEGLDPIDAAIAWAFQVKFGKGAALGQAGHLFFNIKKAGSRAQKELEFESLRLLQPFLRRNWIDLRAGDGAVASVSGDTGSVVVNYFNRVARERRERTFAIRGT